jgi:hypothetical protein
MSLRVNVEISHSVVGRHAGDELAIDHDLHVGALAQA